MALFIKKISVKIRLCDLQFFHSVKILNTTYKLIKQTVLYIYSLAPMSLIDHMPAVGKETDQTQYKCMLVYGTVWYCLYSRVAPSIMNYVGMAGCLRRLFPQQRVRGGPSVLQSHGGDGRRSHGGGPSASPSSSTTVS
jgi:hypothetical protein